MKNHPWYSRLFIACAILATCLSVSGVSAAPIPAHPSPVTVDISSLRTFIDTLPPDEKDEQVRDLAAYGLKSRLAVSTEEEAPIRHPALKDTSPGEVSKGRVFPLSKNEWAVLASHDLLRNKPLIGGLVDKKYAETNSLPEKISLFSYDGTPTSSSIDITFEGTVNSADLFTTEYGYSTATVSTLSDLSKFMKHVDDIVMVQWQHDSLVLGGRSYGHDVRRSLSIEEMAAIYQAYNIPSNLPFARNAQGDAKIGFSLDIDLDYDAFADDMENFAHTSPLLQTLDPAVPSASELVATAGRIRTGKSLTPLITLFRRLAAAGSETDMRIYSALYSFQQYYSYQMARYDGNLQGTQAGMMLFYTDLLAKMWAVDYDGIFAGVGVKGFRPMTEIRIPKQYWPGYGRTAVSRLWFGLKQDGFDVYGNKALFQPIATHVYAASSDLVTPGKEESAPNFQSKEFLGWWDRHYEAVADYEPEYHTLNQLQKWSCIFMLLKVKNLHHLDFLLNIPVKRDIDFEVWNKNNDRLKTKVSISFLDKHKYGHVTECLPLISSKPFPFLAGYGMISGGVTLATQKDIQAKLLKNYTTASPMRRAVNDGSGKNPMPTSMRFTATQKWPFAPMSFGAPPLQAGASVLQKGRVVAETQPAGMPRTPGDKNVPEVPAKDRRADGTGEKQASVRLTWEKSPSLEAINFVTALAALQQSNPQANKGEAIFRGIPDIQSVVRITEWDTYLVKTSALKEMWIFLRVNPSNVAEYPAVAAGSFAEADIFCARLVTAADAQKLANGKQVIR
jgi:hypothetical protein